MSTRGLPGFLRRSRRWDDDFGQSSGDDNSVDTDDDDDDNNNEDNRNGDANSAHDDCSSNRNERRRRKDNNWREDSADSNAHDNVDDGKHGNYLTNGGTNESEQVQNSLSFLDPSPLDESPAKEDLDGENTTKTDTAPSDHPCGTNISSSKNGTAADSSSGDDRSLSSLGDGDLSASVTALSTNAATSGSTLGGGTKSKPTYRETQFEKILSANVVKLSELRKIGWNGIPCQYRGRSWKILLGYLPTNAVRRQQTLERKRSEYREAIRQHYDIDDNSRTLQEQETLRQVLVDVPRTAPEVPLFRNEKIKRSLARLLYIWAMRHPASSYVQGINDLATPLFAVFLGDYYDGEDVLDGSVMVVLSEERLDEVEADVYWCLTNMLAGIQDHYTADQPGVQRMVMRLEELVKRIDSDLCEHIQSVGIQFMQFAFKWMNCLLLREFNLRCVIRLWDTYISEEGNGFEDFHVYVCAAFICQFSNQLQEMEFDELFQFMQAVPTEDWGETEIEMLLSQAFVLSTLFGGSDAHLMSNNGRMT